jgi:hypothetical protein
MVVPAAPDWTNAKIFDPYWNGRADAALPLIRGRRVADIGCGAPQYLKSILSKHVEYRPADLTRWSADTEECDLQAGRFPARSLSKCDTAVVLGVLEYLTDVPAALRGLGLARSIVFSYRFKARNASDASRPMLQAALRSMGFRITGETMFADNTIIRAVRGWPAWGEILKARLARKKARWARRVRRFLG